MLNKMYTALRNKFDAMAFDWHHYSTLERVSVCALALVCLAVLTGATLFPTVRFIVGSVLALVFTMSTIMLALNGMSVLFDKE